MAKKRRFVAYRRLERPYTRKSKFRRLNFVRATPVSRVVRYNMGDQKSNFAMKFYLVVDADLQIRHNAIESSRLTCNRLLERTLGKKGYYLKIRVYPHHLLRENPLASGAGADRMSTGMKKSFGKVIGLAARLKKGQPLFELNVPKNQHKTAREALRRASMKLPCSCKILEESELLAKYQ